MKRVKLALIFYTLLFSKICAGQEITYNITGTLSETQDCNYAFLAIKPNTILKTEAKLLKSKIQNHQFSFSGNHELNGNLVNYADIFFVKDSIIPSMDSIHRHKLFKIRMFILEDCSILAKSPDDSIQVMGSALNKEMDVFNKFRKSTNMLDFVPKYPDSPISLLIVGSLAGLSKTSNLTAAYDLRALFLGLSPRLRMSEEGKVVERLIFSS